MTTQIFEESFKGFPVIAIWEVDRSGNKKGFKPLISFGTKKAQAIFEHKEELAAWLRRQTLPETGSNCKQFLEDEPQFTRPTTTYSRAAPQAHAPVHTTSDTEDRADTYSVTKDSQMIAVNSLTNNCVSAAPTVVAPAPTTTVAVSKPMKITFVLKKKAVPCNL